MQTILFDLDDTLFDHRHASLCALATIRSAHIALQAIEIPALETIYREWLERTHLDVLAGRLTFEKARALRWQKVFAHVDALIDDFEADTIARMARNCYQQNRQVVAGTVELLTTLRERGLKIGIITNNMTVEQVEKLAHCGITDLIDDLLTAEDAQVTKPDPRIFQMALARLNTSPDKAVMVGDSWASDVLGARTVGICAIWLNRYDDPCPDPTLATEIRTLAEIPALLF
jgi:2-haloalkanoic acid dehalogenase type II